MPARLIVHPADGPVAELPLAEDREHVVGREPGCAVHLDDDRVSRRHARLSPLGGGRWRLADRGSKNGVTLDGRPVTSAEIAGTAWLGFGGLLARFDPAGAPSPEAALAEELRRRRGAAELERRLDPAEGLEPLLRRLLGSVLTVAGAERGFVVLARPQGVQGEEGAGFDVVATAGLGVDEIAGEEFSGSVGAVERSIAERRPVVLSDVAADTLFGGRPSIVQGGIRALVCLPLGVLDRVLGAVYADSREPGRAFTRLDVEILEGLAGHAALALAVVQLRQEVAGIGEEQLGGRAAAAADVGAAGAAEGAGR
jgi:hypothetical protein